MNFKDNVDVLRPGVLEEFAEVIMDESCKDSDMHVLMMSEVSKKERVYK